MQIIQTTGHWDHLPEPTTAYIEQIRRTDGLTGLWNRACFDEWLAHEIDCARCTDQPLSLVMLDVDRFAEVNTLYGRTIADEALRIVAQRLRAQSLDSDVLCRWDGNKFAMMCPASDHAIAGATAERMRQWLALRPTTDQVWLTLSAGVAALEPGETAGMLCAHALAALHQAKRSGRNRVASWKGEIVGARKAA
jgi:diguanylate cyclase (GGDEF)-like protein